MKLREKWEKQNNSVKLLLKKLKRHDTLVVAVAVVIALVLCGGLIYISTPVVAASAKEEFAESERESKQQTSDKLDELHEYLTQLDQSITDSQEGLDSFYELTKEDKSKETINEKVTTIGGNLKEIHESVNATQTEINNLKEYIEKSNGESGEKIEKDFANITDMIKEIQSSYEKAQSDNSALMKEIKDLIDKNDTDLSKTLNQRFDNLNKKLEELDQNFTTNFEKLINETNNNFVELNQNITNNFENMSSANSSELNAIKEFISGEMNGLNGKIDQVFQRVSDGKKLLASALLTKGVTINEDATFLEFSEAIRSIPQQIVLGNGDVAGKVEYEYHYHTDGNGLECDENYISEDRKGGCYTEAVYHKHTDSCYTSYILYTYETGRDVERLDALYDSGGETHYRWRCNYCGVEVRGSNGRHHERTTNVDVIGRRKGVVVRTEIKKRLNCKYSDGQFLGYKTSCGLVHGQVVKAHITFGKEYEDYNSTVDIPRGNQANINTSNILAPRGNIDINSLLFDFSEDDEVTTDPAVGETGENDTGESENKMNNEIEENIDASTESSTEEPVEQVTSDEAAQTSENTASEDNNETNSQEETNTSEEAATSSSN